MLKNDLILVSVKSERIFINLKQNETNCQWMVYVFNHWAAERSSAGRDTNLCRGAPRSSERSSWSGCCRSSTPGSSAADWARTDPGRWRLSAGGCIAAETRENMKACYSSFQVLFSFWLNLVSGLISQDQPLMLPFPVDVSGTRFVNLFAEDNVINLCLQKKDTI